MRRPAFIIVCFLIASCSDNRPAAVVTKTQSSADAFSQTEQTNPVPGPGQAGDFAALDQYLKQFARRPQQFIVGADSNSIIWGTKGSRISVVPADLECTDGTKLSDKIAVELIELQTQEDLLRHGVATTSDGRLLESGGSYYINMRSGGKPLRLKSGRQLAVMFPKKSQGEMQLFYGVTDGAGDVNWKATNVAFTPLNANRDADLGPIAEGLYTGAEPGRTGKAGDSTVLRYEIPKYKDTILETLEMRPDHPQKKITPEMRQLYAPVEIKVIDGSFYIVGRVRDTVNRWYAERKVAGINRLISDYYEVMRLTNLGWCNIDRLANRTLFAMRATASTENSIRAVEVFFVYKDMNTVVRKRLTVDDNGSIPLEDIAGNTRVKIIAMAWQDGAAYAYTQTLRASKDAKVRLDLKPVSKEELDRMMTM